MAEWGFDSRAEPMQELRRVVHSGRWFLAAREHAHLRDWAQEKVLFSPVFTPSHRAVLHGKGYACKDFNDFAALV